MIVLRWQPCSQSKRGEVNEFELFAGCNPEPLAWLRKRTKLWKAVIWLPGCKLQRQYGELERQQESVADEVQSWFLAAAEALP